MKVLLPTSLLMVLLALAMTTVSVASSRYSVVDIGALDLHNSSTFGVAINNNGVVVGQSLVAGNYHAIYWDGHLHDIGTFGQGSSGATDINDGDVIIGTAGEPGAGTPILFAFHNGQGVNLGSPQNTYDLVAKINDANTIVATPNSVITRCDSARTPYVVVLPSAVRHPLGMLGCNYFSIGIDDRNEILASSYLGSQATGFVSSRNRDFDRLGPNALSVSMFAIDRYTDHIAGTIQVGQNLFPVLYMPAQDKLIRLPPTSPRLRTGLAFAINRHDEIVGTACPSTLQCDGGNHPFLFDPRVGMTDLLVAAKIPKGFSTYEAVAINDKGQVVVNASNPFGPNRAFLLTPM